MNTTTALPQHLLPQHVLPRQVRPAAAMVAYWLRRFAGMTPNEIAGFLRRHQIRATPGIPTECALARFLCREAGRDVAVDTNRIYICLDGFILPTPHSVRDFIVMFDSRCYPELEDREGRRRAFADLTPELTQHSLALAGVK